MEPDPATETLYRLPTYTHSGAQGVWLTALLAGALDLAASSALAGSYLARRWDYLAGLGAPWLRGAAYPQRGALALAALGTGALLLAGALAATGRRRDGARAAGARSAGALLAAAPLALPGLLALYMAALAPVYSPLAFARWAVRYGREPALAPGIAAARLVLFGSLGPLLAVTLGAAGARLGRLRETGDTHGSSHWASRREVAATGLLGAAPRPAAARQAAARQARPSRPVGGGLPEVVSGPPPVVLAPPAVVVGAWRGRAPGRLLSRVHRLADARDRHVLAFAPSGSGKSSALVVPTLLTCTSSVVALDIKGELWHLTAGYRSQVLGQPCLRVDLGCTDGSGAAYNPLLAVPRGAGDVKHAQSIADVLVDPEGRDRQRSFWEESAHALLTACVLEVVYSAPAEDASGARSLAGCARLLSDPRRPLQETLAALLTACHDPGLELGWRDPHTGLRTETHPAVAAAARSLLDMDPRTASGIVATAQSHLALFRDPVLAANTSRSDFEPLDLVAGELPVSLYLTLAPADLDRLRGPIRLLLNQLCRALTERLDFEPASSRPARRHPLLLLLDEFAVLGRLDFFGRAMNYLRGYGIRVYLSVQSLSQLHDIYGHHQSITANCPLQVAFAPADVETAELLSRMVGPTTVHLAKRSLDGAALALGPRRHTLSVQELARPLLTAEEVRRLPDGEALIFAAGHAAIRGQRVPYYLDPELAWRARIAAPRESDRLLGRPGGLGGAPESH
jgi:type IV secretion system protein VirD4